VDAAFEISRINADFNRGVPKNMLVKRFILIGAGEAVVGNLSGYSSSIELTAIGKPINQLSRIDEFTKNLHAQELLKSGDILFADEMFPYFQSYINLEETEILDINLNILHLKVRDFEEIGRIYICRSKFQSEKREGAA
jgi:class 3 adenylate cyclase